MAIYGEYKSDVARLGIWKMDETVDELLHLLPEHATDLSVQGASPIAQPLNSTIQHFNEQVRADYEAALQRFTAPHRQREWLAVRVLLYHLLGKTAQIAYQPSGKPYLVNGSHHISISHTKGYVAVILSPTSPVGIDIEQYGARIHKVAHKFMREDEEAIPYQDDATWPLLLHWSAKEVMFKSMHTAEVDFREHLHILPFKVCSEGVFTAREYRTPKQQTFQIHYQIHPHFVVTWQVSSLKTPQ